MPPSCSPSLAVVSVSGSQVLLHITRLSAAVYVFIGSVIVGNGWYRIVPGTIVGIIGLAYAVLEYIPSIEPPANMRYVQIIVETPTPY
jgi:COPI associated protein